MPNVQSPILANCTMCLSIIGIIVLRDTVDYHTFGENRVIFLSTFNIIFSCNSVIAFPSLYRFGNPQCLGQSKTPRQVLWDTVDYHTYGENRIIFLSLFKIIFPCNSVIAFPSLYRCGNPQCLKASGASFYSDKTMQKRQKQMLSLSQKRLLSLLQRRLLSECKDNCYHYCKDDCYLIAKTTVIIIAKKTVISSAKMTVISSSKTTVIRLQRQLLLVLQRRLLSWLQRQLLSECKYNWYQYCKENCNQ